MTKRFRIFVFTHDLLGDPFWKVFCRGLHEAADRFACEIRHFRPNSYSPVALAALMTNCLRERPDGILTTVPDAAAVERPLREAISGGVPVIAVNAADPRPSVERIPYLMFIGGDDRAAGAAAARRILDGGCCHRALCIDHYSTAQSCHAARVEGFALEMGSAGVPCEHLRVDNQAAVAAIAGRLREQPDIDAVLTLGPPGASALFLAVLDTNRWARMRHVTFDLSEEQLEAIRDGRAIAAIDSQQYLQAYLGIAMLNLHMKYSFTLPDDIVTGPLFVDRINLEKVQRGCLLGVR